MSSHASNRKDLMAINAQTAADDCRLLRPGDRNLHAAVEGKSYNLQINYCTKQ